MTAKEYLSRAFLLNKIIKAKETSIQQLRDRQMHVSALLSDVKVQTSTRMDPMAEITTELLDLIGEYKKDLQRLIDVRREIHQIIAAVIRDDCRLILTERYINLKRWEEIAADNNYSWKWVHVLHGRALNDVEQYIEVHTLDAV